MDCATQYTYGAYDDVLDTVKHDDFLYHCGECYACIERQTGFKDAGYDDPTKYFNRIEGEK